MVKKLECCVVVTKPDTVAKSTGSRKTEDHTKTPNKRPRTTKRKTNERSGGVKPILHTYGFASRYVYVMLDSVNKTR